MTDYNPQRLRALGAEKASIEARLKRIKPEIADQIRAGAAAGASWTELVELSRTKPETMRRIRDDLDRLGKPRTAREES